MRYNVRSSISGSLLPATSICILCPLGIGAAQLSTTQDCEWVVVVVPPPGLTARIKVASESGLVMLRHLCYVCIICENRKYIPENKSQQSNKTSVIHLRLL